MFEISNSLCLKYQMLTAAVVARIYGFENFSLKLKPFFVFIFFVFIFLYLYFLYLYFFVFLHSYTNKKLEKTKIGKICYCFKKNVFFRKSGFYRKPSELNFTLSRQELHDY